MTEASVHEALLQWATDTQNVTVSGVQPTSFPSKGLGMAATRDIKGGDQLIHVPVTSLLTVHPDVPPPAQANLSLHGRLALALTFPSLSPKSVGDRELSAWKCIMPSSSSLHATMPALWPADLQAQLPHAAAKLLAKQQAKMDADIAAAVAGILTEYAKSNNTALDTCRQQFEEGWLLVNTRCFYWDYPVFGGAIPGKPKTRIDLKRGRDGKTKRVERKRERDDCMAMCPVLDYFNHADGDGLKVEYNELGFTVRADRDYAQGEELCISYGKHSNDFLLVEYGFSMTTNSSDHLTLDHLILPRLSSVQQDELNNVNLLGEYTLSPTSAGTNPTTRDLVCYRTQSALRILILPLPRWRRFVSGFDYTDGAHEQDEVDALLVELLGEYHDEIGATVGKVKTCNFKHEEDASRNDELRSRTKPEVEEAEEARHSLLRRWRQIQEAVDNALLILRQKQVEPKVENRR